jgi:hypothetical protein
MTSRRVLARVLAPVLLAATGAGCGAAAVSSLAEDKARRDIPIAICRKALAPTELTENGGPKPEAYWALLVPTFHGFGVALEPGASNCVGEPARTPAQETAASASRTAVVAGDSTVSPAGDGIEIAWLRTSAISDRVAAGLLAIVRPRPSEIDVYSIGSYQGSARHSRFELLHLGTTIGVLARDEACADVKVDTECESVATIYVVAGGQLTAAAKTTLERMQFGTLKDIGKVKYRLTTDPPVIDGATIHVHEHLSVRDASDDEVRKSEGERVFTLSGDDLTASQASIWPPSTGKPERAP